MKPTDEQAEMKRKMSERMGISVAAQAAKNIAEIAISNGIPTINNYFNAESIKNILDKADIITASNVFAHADGLDEIVKPEDAQKKMCPICFESEVNTVLIPCGHTYCKGCSDIDRSRNAKCPQCRSVINSRIKLFFTV
jgi:hypothetical protein